MSALVTAVVPAYNYARFVSRAIDSVLAQTYAPIECVVVDDGSTDDTQGVLDGYAGRIRAIRQDNRGISAARNTGIAAARGEYIAFLDADDWWAPEKIAKQVARIASDHHVAAVGCGEAVVGADMRTVRTVIHPEPSRDRAKNLRAVAVRKLWVGGSASGLLARRRVLDGIGHFDPSLRAAEDWDMWLRLFARHEVRNLPEVLVSLHTHGTGFFRNATLVEENQRRVAARAIERWPDVIGPMTRRRMYALILADAALERMDTPDVACARRKMAAALRLWPVDAHRLRVLLSLTARSTKASLSRIWAS